MATTNIVTGELRNKVGAMVGSKWKGIAYVRAYTKGKDANTSAQKAVRKQFGLITHFGSSINEAVLKPFQAKPVKNQSPYNHFVKINREVIIDQSKRYESVKIFDGPLPVAGALEALASNATKNVEVSFTPLQYGNCRETDVMIAVVYNESNDSFAYAVTERGMDEAPITLSIPAYFAQGDRLYVYLTASQLGSANGGTLAAAITADA